MTAGQEPDTLVPLPMAGDPTRADASPLAPGPLLIVYVRYRDPAPLEFPGVAGLMPGPIFHAAGILLREDEGFLALGEVAFGEENRPFTVRFGADLFPAYRHVLTIPKETILDRRTFPLEGGPPGKEVDRATRK